MNTIRNTQRHRTVLTSILIFFLLLCATIGIYTLLQQQKVSAVTGSDWNAGNIIDDDIFYNGAGMSVPEIQAFLNSKVPTCDTNGTQPASEFGRPDLTHAQYAAAHGWQAPPYICLKDYHQVPRSDQNINNLSTNTIPNGAVSAAQIIKTAADTYNINPKVLIVTLQKEFALTLDSWPLNSQYRNAMGYGCPDTAPCDPQYEGFYNQVMNAAYQFNRYKTNSGSYRYKPFQVNSIYYNPNSNCGATNVYIENYATAGLYNYTPYQPNQAGLNNLYGSGDSCTAHGNRNFWRLFNDWFGSTKGALHYACKGGSNIQNTGTGQRILRNRSGSSVDNLSIVVPNNTGTQCAEVHTWANRQLQSWSQHVATNSYTFDPAYSRTVSAKVNKTQTTFYKVDYMGTASGRVEVHGWTPDLQRWSSHIATNAGPIDPTLSEIITADTNGDGRDEFYLINYQNTGTGMVEVHGWTSNFQGWFLHAPTNLPSIDPTKGRVIAADLNGDGKDEFTYVKSDTAQSGSVELHTWSSNLQHWVRHVATNYPASAYSRVTDDIVIADVDGNGRDNVLYIKYSNTASGRVEVHGWSDNQQFWTSHIATSSGSY